VQTQATPEEIAAFAAFFNPVEILYLISSNDMVTPLLDEL